MPIIKANGATQAISKIGNQINNKHYIHSYTTVKTFYAGIAQVLTTTPIYTIQKNKLIRFNLKVPSRSFVTTWGGLYIQINAKVNGTWYNLGNCGYNGGVMLNASQNIGTHIENKLYDFIGNLGLNNNSTYTLQFEITCRAYTGFIYVNGSQEINQTANNLGVRGPLQSWASDQNYTTITIEEVERY